MACRTIQTFCQSPTARWPLTFDWLADCINVRRSGVDYEIDEVTRPSVASGYQFRCTTAGTTNGSREPKWKNYITEGDTVQDGSVVWTVELLTTESLTRTITTSVWVTDDSSLTADDDDIVSTAGEQSTFAFISGGVVDTTYLVTNHVVFSDGSEDDASANIEVS